jgi:phage shock protein A
MGIFSRFTDIINSNLTALLDQAEDPKKMIRLIIQEMEETLVEVRSSCARIIADKKETARRAQRLQEEALEWEKKARLAISKEREDLARAAISEKNAVVEEAALVSSELEALDAHLETLNDEVNQLQAKLDDARAKQKTLLLRANTVKSRYQVKRQIYKDGVNDAFNKFETFERRMDELEGHVESMDIGRKSLSSEIDQLAEDDKINEALARIKKEMKE